MQRPSRRVAALLLLVLAPCAAVRGRRSAVRAPRPALLRALRGGAAAEDLLWVRNGTSGPLQLVRSLEAFCEEHGLDEEAMLAVSRGEADEHDGWTCGVPLEFDAPAAAVKAEEVPAEEEEEAAASEGAASAEAADEVEAAPKPPPPQMSKLLVGMVAPMGVLQVLKAFDKNSPEFLLALRGVFFGLIALNCLVQMLLEWRIRARNDATPVKMPLNPIALLMGGGGSGGEQTAAVYDKAQLASQRNSYRMGCLFTCLLHFKFKMWQPLVYSSVSGVVDLYYSPLVNIYLFGRKARAPATPVPLAARPRAFAPRDAAPSPAAWPAGGGALCTPIRRRRPAGQAARRRRRRAGGRPGRAAQRVQGPQRRPGELSASGSRMLMHMAADDCGVEEATCTAVDQCGYTELRR
jgi:hypothetical protein